MTATETDLTRDAIVKVLPKAGTAIVYGTIEWRKKGGSTGIKTLESIKVKLMELGFVKQKVSGTSTPTGSAVGFTEVLIHPLGWKASLKQHFGSQPVYIASIDRDTNG